MNSYDLIIIGGGVAGLSCGLVLASGMKEYEDLEDKKVLIIDNDRSDALRAAFFNAPGVKQGISGREAIDDLKNQIYYYDNIDFHKGTVKEIFKKDNFKITTKKDESLNAEKIVLATGFRGWTIKGIDLPVKEFTRSSKPNRVSLKHESYKVDDNIYVCGLLSDVSSHYPIVAGTGAQTAINIMHDWTNKWLVIHDKP